MFNYASYCKRFSFVIIFILLIFSLKTTKPIAYGVDDEDLESELNDNIESILDKKDFSVLD